MRRAERSAVIVRNGAVLALVVAACNHQALPEGLFLALGVLIILETDLGGGVLARRERIIGTLLGLLAVVIGAGLLGGLSSALAVFVGLTLVRLFGFAAGLASGFVVGGYMVAGSLLNHSDAWWHYVFRRMVMTVLGVILGVVVSRQIYSQRSSSVWQASCDGWLLDLAGFLGRLPAIPEPEPLVAALRERRNALRRQLPQLAAERTLIHGQPDGTVLRAQRLIASRLLLLADALIRLPRSPERSGQPQAGR